MPKRNRSKIATCDSQAPLPPPNPATASSAPESEPDIADIYIDDDDESDGDIDVEELEAIMHDVCIDARQIFRSAALGRVNVHTREAYDLHLRQCALWAQSTAQFQHEVTGIGSNVQLKWPLNEEVVVGFISYLQQKQVPWSFSNPSFEISCVIVASH